MKTDNEIIDEILDQGAEDLQDVMDILEDGKALSVLGIADEKKVNEAYELCVKLIKKELVD